uniref:(California timema) hypothetical protein n=1 Tax=Timema californicum TaxID=61474 RepID=A0A7R9JDD4_TIMCA|nr:unnamed protein product [Timema californicum]
MGGGARFIIHRLVSARFYRTLEMIQTKQPSSKIQPGGSGNNPVWNRTSGLTPSPVATRRVNKGNTTREKKGRADTYSPRLVELEFLPETDMTTVNKLVRDFLQHIQERWRVQPGVQFNSLRASFIVKLSTPQVRRYTKYMTMPILNSNGMGQFPMRERPIPFEFRHTSVTSHITRCPGGRLRLAPEGEVLSESLGTSDAATPRLVRPTLQFRTRRVQSSLEGYSNQKIQRYKEEKICALPGKCLQLHVYPGEKNCPAKLVFISSSRPWSKDVSCQTHKSDGLINVASILRKSERILIGGAVVKSLEYPKIFSTVLQESHSNLRNILVHPKLLDPPTSGQRFLPLQQTEMQYSKVHQPSTSFNSGLAKMEYPMKGHYECSTDNLIYQLHYNYCIAEYTGLITETLGQQMNGEPMYSLVEHKICRFFAEVLLKPASKFNLGEFLMSWQQSVPEAVNTREGRHDTPNYFNLTWLASAVNTREGRHDTPNYLNLTWLASAVNTREGRHDTPNYLNLTWLASAVNTREGRHDTPNYLNLTWLASAVNTREGRHDTPNYLNLTWLASAVNTREGRHDTPNYLNLTWLASAVNTREGRHDTPNYLNLTWLASAVNTREGRHDTPNYLNLTWLASAVNASPVKGAVDSPSMLSDSEAVYKDKFRDGDSLKLSTSVPYRIAPSQNAILE